MRLKLYSSVGQQAPNLVSLQADEVDFLPTVLVCPIREDAPETVVRSRFIWDGKSFTAFCEPARPIRRTALTLLGILDASASRDIMDRFLRVLAR